MGREGISKDPAKEVIQMAQIKNFCIVTNQARHSTIRNNCFETNWSGLDNQFRGGTLRRISGRLRQQGRGEGPWREADLVATEGTRAGEVVEADP